MKARNFGRDLLISWSGIFVVLLIWQAVAVLEIINPIIFPGPLAVVGDAFTKVSFENTLLNVQISLVRIMMGFSLGAGLGIVIGVGSGWYRWLGSIIHAPIELLRPIPPLAWIPLAIMWFGLGEQSKVFVIFLGAFFPVLTNAYRGMISIDPDILRAAQVLELKGWRLLLRVALPAALPDIATGVRVGWSLSFGTMVAAELIAADSGLGFMIMNARELGQLTVIIYGIILIGTLNLVTDFLIREFIFKRKLSWHFGTSPE